MIQILAQTDGTSSGGSLISLLFPLVLLGGVFYFLLLRPNRQRQRQQQTLLQSLQVGDDGRTIRYAGIRSIVERGDRFKIYSMAD